MTTIRPKQKPTPRCTMCGADGGPTHLWLNQNNETRCLRCLELETARRKILSLQNEIKTLNKLTENACDECDGSGQYFLDGKPEPCVCVSETEPYQKAMRQRDQAKRLFKLANAQKRHWRTLTLGILSMTQLTGLLSVLKLPTSSPNPEFQTPNPKLQEPGD